MAEKPVTVDEVKAFKTQSGNTRFVLRADDGSEDIREDDTSD